MKIGNEFKHNISTKVVHGSKYYDPHTGAVSFPIYQSATFRHPGLYQTTGYDYSRLQNPTREELENTIANIENGKFGFAFLVEWQQYQPYFPFSHREITSLFLMTSMEVRIGYLRKYIKIWCGVFLC